MSKSSLPTTDGNPVPALPSTTLGTARAQASESGRQFKVLRTQRVPAQLSFAFLPTPSRRDG